jgi:hypothetical protein
LAASRQRSTRRRSRASRAPERSASIALNITGVAGVGTVGTLRGRDDKTLPGVAGIGIVGSLVGVVITKGLPAAQATGQVGAMFGAVSVIVPGVAATALCGQIGVNPGGNPLGVQGIGVVGQIRIEISGGGGNRRKNRGGFEPVKKRYGIETPEPAPKPLLPPDFVRRSPSIAPEYGDPLPLPAGLPAVPSLLDDIEYAERASGILRVLDAHHEQLDLADVDDLTATDIADIMAFLDQMDRHP